MEKIKLSKCFWLQLMAAVAFAVMAMSSGSSSSSISREDYETFRDSYQRSYDAVSKALSYDVESDSLQGISVEDLALSK